MRHQDGENLRFLKIKDWLRFQQLFLLNLLSSLYEWCFIKSVQQCPYFPRGMESFGIMLKGKSLELFPKYDRKFNYCFLVNNYDEEIRLIGNSLSGKKCVHFVNRLMTAPLRAENYQKFNIIDIQLTKVSALGDGVLKKAIHDYNCLGLKVHYLPKKLLHFNRMFGKEYAKKSPNTGILAIAYALEMLRPKTLWIVGLDFYQSDYLVRRPHANPIEVQQAKMKRLDVVGATANIFSLHPDVKIKMVSYYQGFPDLPNVEILH